MDYALPFLAVTSRTPSLPGPPLPHGGLRTLRDLGNPRGTWPKLEQKWPDAQLSLTFRRRVAAQRVAVRPCTRSRLAARGFQSSSCSMRAPTVENDPFVKSQHASHNQLQGLMWRRFDHVVLKVEPTKRANSTVWLRVPSEHPGPRETT